MGWVFGVVLLISGVVVSMSSVRSSGLSAIVGWTLSFFAGISTINKLFGSALGMDGFSWFSEGV